MTQAVKHQSEKSQVVDSAPIGLQILLFPPPLHSNTDFYLLSKNGKFGIKHRRHISQPLILSILRRSF